MNNYEELWNSLKERLKEASDRKHSDLEYKLMMLTGYSAAEDVYRLMQKMERGEEIPVIAKEE